MAFAILGNLVNLALGGTIGGAFGLQNKP
jgi:large-conductance mechanosensitive channel